MQILAKQRRRPRFLEPEEEEFFNAIETALPCIPITDADAISVFPEGEKILRRLIKETKSEIDRINTENLPKFDAALERIYIAGGEDWQIDIAKMLAKFWYLELPMVVRTYAEHGRVITETLQDKLARYERVLKLHAIRHAVVNSPDEVNELTIRNAKEVRLEDLLSEKPNHAGFIKCPFHNEKTASCKIQNNRFHCFGCHEDGDVIDWVMKTEGKDFLSAVRQLNKKA